MNRIAISVKRLLVGILCVLLFLPAVPVLAYTEGEVATYVAKIPVAIENALDAKASIEQLEGPRIVLPDKTELEMNAAGENEFELSFADANAGEIFKYRITETPGAEANVTYNVEEKTYIGEVWIFRNPETDTVYARAFLYESEEPLDLSDEDVAASVAKPERCDFVNETAAEPPTAVDASSRGRKGETQASDGSVDTIDKTGEVRFNRGSGAFVEATLLDPRTGKPAKPDANGIVEVDALDQNGNKVGVYRMVYPSAEELNKDPGSFAAVVMFIPNSDFTGSPRAAQVQIRDANGLTATANYTPYVVAPPAPQGAESWGKQGEKQSSDGSGESDTRGEVFFQKGDGAFVSMTLLDPYTGEPTDKTVIDALDASGKKIGTYRLIGFDLESGRAVIEFTPDPDFVGDPQPCGVRAEDEYGYVADAYYQPHVAGNGKDSTPSVTPPSKPTPSPIPTPSAKKASALVKTGDYFRAHPYLFALAGAFAALVILLAFRRKNNKK